MQFYAFDSFQGLPADISQDEKKYNHFYKGQYTCSEEEFINILAKSGVCLNKDVTIVPGFYDPVLTDELKNRLPIKRAAVIWIDCDLYDSTIHVLDFVSDYLTTGTFILFDDWFSFGANPNVGEMRATKEWLARNHNIILVEYHKFHTFGILFLVQKNGR